MEHRTTTRRRLTLRARLFLSGNYLGRFVCADIGNGGIALQGCPRNLKINSLVTVGLKSPNYGEAHLYYKALVVHKSPERVGLMWVEDFDLAALLSRQGKTPTTHRGLYPSYTL